MPVPDATSASSSVAPLRALFLGNEDNLNLRLCLWARELGVDADLMLIGDERSPRGRPDFLVPSFRDAPPAWLKKLPISNPLRFAKRFVPEIRAIEREYAVVISSGFSSLIASHAIRLPRVHMSVGSEIGIWPLYGRSLRAPTRYAAGSPRWALAKLAYLRSTHAIRRSLKTLSLIVDSFSWNLSVLERLGYADKVLFLAFGEDVDRVRRAVDPIRLSELEKRFAPYRRVFAWFSRLNFLDAGANSYKGAELFLDALLQMRGPIESGEVAVVIGRHGNDTAAFEQRAKATWLYPHIQWVDHLPHDELLAYLMLPRLALFAEFGDVNDGLSGIGRDAASVGTVTVSSCRPDVVARQYGRAAPILQANSPAEIAERMRETIEMSDAAFDARREEMRTFGRECLDYRARFAPRFVEALHQTIAAYPGKPALDAG